MAKRGRLRAMCVAALGLLRNVVYVTACVYMQACCMSIHARDAGAPFERQAVSDASVGRFSRSRRRLAAKTGRHSKPFGGDKAACRSGVRRRESERCRAEEADETIEV